MLVTNKNTRSIHVICVTLSKMAGVIDERDATFQFIDQGNSQLSRFVGHFVSSIQRHKKQANKNGTAVTVRSKGGISADIRFHPNLSIFPALSVSSSALNIK